MAGRVSVLVERVVKVYESAAGPVVALREVSLEARRGEVLAIMGPSGSGKTTLLNLIAGVDRPTAGRIVVEGHEVSRMGDEELRRFRARVVGYVLQQNNLIPGLTALENVLLPMAAAGRPDVARARRLLAEVGLEGKEDRFPEELSGGEQQRLAVAVALANDPPVIVADEPTGELDIATGERVVRLLVRQGREAGKTVIMTTHDPRVARMADRVVLLEDGRVVGVYDPRKVGYLGAAEVEAERVVVEHLKRMLEDVRSRLARLSSELASGRLGLDEAVRVYLKLRSLEEALVEELARLGAGVEALEGAGR